jgi:acetyltransferase-like isoleucine patch superfamily enzyme
LQRAYPGVEIDPTASTNLAVARWELEPGARVIVEPGVVTERLPGALRIHVLEGGELRIGADTWLRTEVGPIQLVVHRGARIELAREVWLNACSLSAKAAIVFERGASLGPGSRVYDSDQHDLDADRPEQTAPVRIGAYTWVTSSVTVLKGVSIGAHSVIGAHSLVNKDVPDHRLAFGVPAKVRGEIGDRTKAMR